MRGANGVNLAALDERMIALDILVLAIRSIEYVRKTGEVFPSASDETMSIQWFKIFISLSCSSEKSAGLIVPHPAICCRSPIPQSRHSTGWSASETCQMPYGDISAIPAVRASPMQSLCMTTFVRSRLELSNQA
jgi:hypothetical protein